MKEKTGDRYGFCVWFTGLSGAGKTTTADALIALLRSHGRDPAMLDGDLVRAQLSTGLGFSKEDRDENVQRIGRIASELVAQGQTVVCAAISPYRAARHECRRLVGPERFVEVFVRTPLDVCETRDPKGLYARARRGEIAGISGLDAPYEPPAEPEVVLDTTSSSAGENATLVLKYLETKGLL